MLSLAKLGQTGARRVVPRGGFMKDGRCQYASWPDCPFVPRTKNMEQSFSYSSFNHYRCFSATAASSSPTTNQKTPSFSYVIVGAGSAGCVLANRLTEDAHESVLLLEAGPKDMLLGSVRLSWKIHMPAALTYNLCDNKYSRYVIAGQYKTVLFSFVSVTTLFSSVCRHKLLERKYRKGVTF